MRKSLLAALALVATTTVFTGCTITPASFSSGSTFPALIYTSGLTYPAENTSSTQYVMNSDDFTVIGAVRAEGESTNIFGIIASGTNGYELLLQEVQARGGDDVINVRADVTSSNILGFTTVKTTYMGTAISYN
ncbi:MAG: hypothetical protein ACFCU1_04765 [Sumerlaeia bacterium]